MQNELTSEYTIKEPTSTINSNCSMKRIAALLFFLALAIPVFAQQLGEITFPTSATSETAQQHFISGVKLLHSFEYDDAAEAFRKAQESEPSFAMAYWGEAMTFNHPIWHREYVAKANEALSKLDQTASGRLAKSPTPREKDFMDATNILFGEGTKRERNARYREKMRSMSLRYPEDHEVKAFYALSILGTSHEGRDFSTYMKAASVAEEVFAQNPQHPGAAHYLIHSYDDPIHAPLGQRAANVYSEIAPDAAHALHMPTHIFVALGEWDRVEELNARSWSASEKRVARKGLAPTARTYHAIWWRAYALMQQNRQEDALDLIGILQEDAVTGNSGAIFHLAAMHALFMVDSEDWDHEIRDIDIDTQKSGSRARIIHSFARGYAHAMAGRWEEAAMHENKIRAVVSDLMSANPDEGYNPDRDTGKILAMQLEALAFFDQGKVEKSLLILNEAASLESAMPFSFGPPRIVKPTHELLGEVLYRSERYADAVGAFSAALDRNPKRRLALEGLAAAAKMAGFEDVARNAQDDLDRISELSLPERPHFPMKQTDG